MTFEEWYKENITNLISTNPKGPYIRRLLTSAYQAGLNHAYAQERLNREALHAQMDTFIRGEVIAPITAGPDIHALQLRNAPLQEME